MSNEPEFMVVTCPCCMNRKVVPPFYGSMDFKCPSCHKVFRDTVEIGLFVVQDEVELKHGRKKLR